MNKKFFKLLSVGVLIISGIVVFIYQKYNRPLVTVENNQSTGGLFQDCESKSGEVYTNLKPATIEKVNDSYLFTINCDMPTSVWMKTPAFNLDSYLNKPVLAKYKYFEFVENVQCFKAPCPPISQKLVEIISLKEWADTSTKFTK